MDEDLWEKIKEEVEILVNSAYGTDPRHGLLAMHAANKIVHGTPVPLNFSSHFGRW